MTDFEKYQCVISRLQNNDLITTIEYEDFCGLQTKLIDNTTTVEYDRAMFAISEALEYCNITDSYSIHYDDTYIDYKLLTYETEYERIRRQGIKKKSHDMIVEERFSVNLASNFHGVY